MKKVLEIIAVFVLLMGSLDSCVVNDPLCIDGHINFNNVNDDPYLVEISCPDLNYDWSFTLDGYATETQYVTPGHTYKIKLTQKSGYLLYPSTKEYTIDTNCGNTYTCETPHNFK